MAWRLLADAVVLFHLAFVVFVVAGGVLARWWRRAALVHLPCALYGAAIEVRGWVCPLTPLENHLRALAGERGYTGGFVEHYVVHLIYPEPLTVRLQAALAAIVVVANAAVYAWALRRRSTAGAARPSGKALR